jgi:hypothetical protein
MTVETLRASLLRDNPPTGVMTWTAEEYFASGALGGSGFGPAMQSGRHWLQDQQRERSESPAMRFGTAGHCALLEPAEWGKRYAPAFDVGKTPAEAVIYESGKDVGERLKALKSEGHAVKVSGSNAEKMTALQAVEPHACYLSDLVSDHARENSGRILLSADDEARCTNAVHAVLEWHERWTAAGNVPVLGGRTEQRLAWVDEGTGLYCRAAVDIVSPCQSAWGDLKFTHDAGPAFDRHAKNYNYPEQGAHYLDGYRAISGQDVTPRWFWLVVEAEPPHGVRLVWASADVLARARRRRRIAMERILEVLIDPSAPVYPVEADTMELTAWERREEDNNE